MNLKPQPFLIAALLLISILLIARLEPWESSFEESKEIISMRKIGHEVLLHSGDSTSRVLPVKKLAEREYQIRFESPIIFNPDSLVKVIRLAVSNSELPSDYVVKIVECAENQIIFAYAILKTEQTDIIPCSGRPQPKGCYYINVAFRNTGLVALQSREFTLGTSLLAIVLSLSGFALYYKNKVKSGSDTVIPIGNYLFYTEKQYLEIYNTAVPLTIKESRVLEILANAPNEVIERSRLQKIWEDEGVIVGRSLDMFVSKLRRKLGSDSDIKLLNIYGRGYKLVMPQYQ